MKNKHSRLKLFSAIMVPLLVIGIISAYITMHNAQAVGNSWSIVSSPNASPQGNALQSVAALSTNKVWAVGRFLQGATSSAWVERTLVERYNGTIWQVMTSPNVGDGDNVLTGVVAIAANNVWAVGSSPQGALILHYDGTEWRLVSAPTACQLNAVTATAANDVWAVGTLSNRSCTEHYNGASWHLLPTPHLGTSDNTLLGVSAISAHDVWAVGKYCVGNACDRDGEIFHTLVLHYTGVRWNVVASPNPGPYYNQLSAVTAISATNVWAVGLRNTSRVTATLIEHFDGMRWIQVASPGVGIMVELRAIASVSATNIFAVGLQTTSIGALVTLIEHFNGTTWSIVENPLPRGKNFTFSGIVHVPGASSGTAKFWVVGSYVGMSGSTLTEGDI